MPRSNWPARSCVIFTLASSTPVYVSLVSAKDMVSLSSPVADRLLPISGNAAPNDDDGVDSRNKDEIERIDRERRLVMAIYGDSSYDLQLPDRIVTENPFGQVNGPIVSYGVICWSEVTNRWLMVRRYRSLEYLSLLQGKWRKAELPVLVDGLSRDEAKFLLRWCQNGCPRDAFVRLYDASVYGGTDAVDYGYKRLTVTGVPILLSRLLRQALNGTTLASSPEWMWPKGRLDQHDDTIRDCALRELFEETQLVVAPRDLHGEPLSERWYGTNGLLYEVRCWFHVIASPLVSVPTNDDLEDTPPEADLDSDDSSVEAVDLLPEERSDLLPEDRVMDQGVDGSAVDDTTPIERNQPLEDLKDGSDSDDEDDGPREIGAKAWLTDDEIERCAKPWSIRLLHRCRAILDT